MGRESMVEPLGKRCKVVVVLDPTCHACWHRANLRRSTGRSWLQPPPTVALPCVVERAAGLQSLCKTLQRGWCGSGSTVRYGPSGGQKISQFGMSPLAAMLYVSMVAGGSVVSDPCTKWLTFWSIACERMIKRRPR